MDEKNISFFRFEDLRVYDKALDYSSWILEVLNTSRNEAQAKLVASFCSSAFDIELNIAEGSSRNRSQFEHYLKISKTAIRECVIYTALAHRAGLLTDEQGEQSRQHLMELTRMVGALIVSLQRNSQHRHNDDLSDDAIDDTSIDIDSFDIKE